MNIGFRGLWSNPNDLEAPQGAAKTADNVVVDRPQLVEPRRGFSTLEGAPSITGPINALTVFSGSLIAHHSTASVSRWTGSAWSTYSGTYNPPDASTPVTFLLGESSLFMTTSAGVYELDSPTGTWRKTGAPRALDGTAALNRTSGTSGWATPDGQWAYRDVWVYRNGNNKLQFGAPSGRMIFTNPATRTVVAGQASKLTGTTTVTATFSSAHGFVVGDVLDITGTPETYFATGLQVTVLTVPSSVQITYSDGINNGTGATQTSTDPMTYGFTARNVTRTVRVPKEITSSSGWVVQVYRSAKSASDDATPGEGMGLVVERAPTNLDITNGYVTITDFAPDDLRGADLYTSLQGLVAAKDQPPVCVDMAEFRQSYWCVNTNRSHRQRLTLLSVDTTSGLRVNDIITLRSPLAMASGSYYTASSLAARSTETISSGEFKVYTSGSVAQNIADTAQSIVRVINGWSGTNTVFRAFYISADTNFPGQILVETIDQAKGAFTAVIGAPTAGSPPGDYFAPDVPYVVAVPDTDIVRVGSTVTVTCDSQHGLAVGQQFQLDSAFPDANFPVGTKTVVAVNSTTEFTYTEAGAAASSVSEYVILDHPPTLTSSENDDFPNALHWSSPSEPWSFPVAQQTFVGSPDNAIHRVIPASDRLFVLTAKGLYKVTGNFPFWNVSEVDKNLKLKGRGLATALKDRLWAYTDAGWVEALDTATTRSIPLEKTLRDLEATVTSTVLSREGFAVGYESDRRLIGWMPTTSADTQATQAYVLNMVGSPEPAWTRWDVDATCAIVHPTEDKLYVGTASGAVWVERKARALADYQDPGGAAISSVVEWTAQVNPPEAMKFWESGSLDFNAAQFTSGTLQFMTDFDDYDSGTTIEPPMGSTTNATRIEFWTPANWKRSVRLGVKWSHSTAEKSFVLGGLNLKYRVINQKAGR